ncbi:MAG: hypothetical protein IPL84_05065 [Chitinophagaceae bacterium]|nr:hypothetical protein [Chitinophagaceae bacterium]
MNEFDYDMINRYLDGEMTPEEKNAFELGMQQNTDLQNEVDLVKDVQSTLKIKLHPTENELAVRNSIAEIKTEYFSNKTQTAKIASLGRNRWVTAIAAVFVLALVLTVWRPWKKEDLYQQYAAIDMPATAERGSTTDSLLNLAVANFNSKNFAEAIPLFETVLKDSAQNNFVQYFYGIALLQDDQIEKARIQLTGLSTGSSIFRNEALFYMALSYLKEKNRTACKDWLKKIPLDDAAWVKAQGLLKKL